MLKLNGTSALFDLRMWGSLTFHRNTDTATIISVCVTVHIVLSVSLTGVNHFSVEPAQFSAFLNYLIDTLPSIRGGSRSMKEAVPVKNSPPAAFHYLVVHPK